MLLPNRLAMVILAIECNIELYSNVGENRIMIQENNIIIRFDVPKWLRAFCIKDDFTIDPEYMNIEHGFTIHPSCLNCGKTHYVVIRTNNNAKIEPGQTGITLQKIITVTDNDSLCAIESLNFNEIINIINKSIEHAGLNIRRNLIHII